jgi:predicted AAA+ superfamily ATPase
VLKEKLEEIVKDQRNTLLQKDNSIARDDLSKITSLPGFATIISGIRRCGKSTLLKQMLKKEKAFYYINLEDIKLNDFELSDFIKLEEIFTGNYGKNGVYFFDEIQSIPKWEKYVRRLTDKKNKVIITGSNASLLSRELGTLLTGRHASYELFPFTYNEFLKFRKLKPSKTSIKYYLEQGGFPEYLKHNKSETLQELLKDVIMRDVAIRFSIRNTDLLKKIAIYLISNVGKEMTYNKIKKTFSVPSIQTVIDYVSFFEDAYLIFTLPRFSYSQKKTADFSKKSIFN